MTFYFYEFKQQVFVAGNKSLITEREMALVAELNRIFLLHKDKATLNFAFKTNEELQQYFTRYKAPHHILGKPGLTIPPEKKIYFLYGLIDKAIDRQSQRGKISLYLQGYSAFESITLKPAPLKTNNSYRQFQINNTKSTPEEYYFANITIQTYHKPPPQSQTAVEKCIKVLKFYGIPKEVKFQKGNIDLEKALTLLRHFSIFKGPERRVSISERQNIVTNRGDNKFIELFGTNESISLFDYDKLINGIVTYFNWRSEVVRMILAFLTFDVNEQFYPVNWVSKPFIKLGNKVVWLGSFLRDRRWENVIINKLKQEREFKSMVYDLAKNLELRVEDLFKNNGFKTLQGLRYTSINGQSGDHDVLAYKDRYLIVGEVKSGQRSDDFAYANYAETIRLEGCAAEQLEKGLSNINENWEKIKSLLEIDDDIDLNSVQVIPLIITDYFEGDAILYKNKFRKTTLLELDVIFNNKKRELIEVYEFEKSSNDALNTNLKRFRSCVEKWDLWNGKATLDIPTLLDIIDDNTIWKEIERIWKFEKVPYLI